VEQPTSTTSGEGPEDDSAAHRLTPAQAEAFATDGYLLVKGVVSPSLVARALDAADQMISEYEAEKPEKHGGVYTIISTLLKSGHTNGAIDQLMDHPALFPILLDLMGPYITIMGSQIYVRYPSLHAADPSRMLSDWHTDAGPSLGQIHVTEDSLPINLKVQFFLTDIQADNSANFCVVPGSHRTALPTKAERALEPGWPRDARQLLVEAGDVAIFPNTLWHGVSSNQQESNVRRSLTFRYGQMWSRPCTLSSTLPPPPPRVALSPARLRNTPGTDDVLRTLADLDLAVLLSWTRRLSGLPPERSRASDPAKAKAARRYG
jgi:ectoine hydroxylase-related dioxygenase (phytanoyl-CoA dioxygenase family)